MAQRRKTHQRELVREAVSALHTHPTAAQVYEYVHMRNDKVSLATVYRNLNLLVEEGDILAIDTTAGRHFDHRTDNHGHLVCRVCGAMMDVAVPCKPTIDDEVSKLTGYSDVCHRILFEGICPNCAR